jgi:hypothetical protein
MVSIHGPNAQQVRCRMAMNRRFSFSTRGNTSLVGRTISLYHPSFSLARWGGVHHALEAVADVDDLRPLAVDEVKLLFR